MTRRPRLATWLRRCAATAILGGLSISAQSVLFAQDDPFGGGAAVAKPVAPAAKPTKGRNLTIPNDPAVREILESKPASAAEFARATRNLLNLGYPEHALIYLEGLERSNPSPDDWLALQATFGTDFFLRLGREPQLQPAGARVSRAALNAVKQLTLDPRRIDQLITQLGSDDANVRGPAVLALRQVGVPAIPPLVTLLADDGRSSHHRSAQMALLELGEMSVEPLIGALEAPLPGLRARAFETLGALRNSRALGYLVRPVQKDSPDAELRQIASNALFQIIDSTPDRYDAERFLRRRINDLLAGTTPVRLDADNRGELWHWDAAKKTVAPIRYGQRDVGLVEAARLARELYALAPDSIDNRRLYLAAELEAAKALGGLDRPLPRGAGTALDKALAFGGNALEDLLVEMTKRQRVLAAACAVEALGELGSEEFVQATAGTPRPLVLALAHSDRRLRFAALQAIVKIDPKSPFAGSNYVGETIGFLAGSVGSRRALVAHHRLEEARTMAGHLQQLGYEADTVTSSRGVFIQASRQPDYEFLLLSDTINGPSVKELLPQLRQDKRTSGIAVGVLVNLAIPVDGGVVTDSDVAAKSADNQPDAAANATNTPADDSTEDAQPAAKPSAKPELGPMLGDVPRPRRTFAADTNRRGSEYFNRTAVPVDPMIRVRQWTVGDERTDAFARPYDVDGMESVVRQLKATAGRGTLSLDERVTQAEFALQCLARFAAQDDRYEFLEVFRHQAAAESALRTPGLMPSASHALAALGSPRAQVALVDFASEHGRPLEDRQRAAAAFAAAVQRRSLRLTRTEILRQYERYNQSERQDAGTQQVLGTILDIIEAVDAANKERVSAPAAESATPTNAPAP